MGVPGAYLHWRYDLIFQRLSRVPVLRIDFQGSGARVRGKLRRAAMKLLQPFRCVNDALPLYR